ncbi:MAG TPA: S-layer homology domain-containing protein [Vicinamibacteria bacterium]|nr:S-layer homology domain-containing protein [Vicinamibacteria bacterium]
MTLSPTALSVDAAGNRVLQPNEGAVSVAPSWQNSGTTAAPVTGTASNFTGPVGPTYTITDNTADYGTIGAGSTASCTDCYGVSVAASGRPAQHWDTTMQETVLPTSTVKTWTLHVGDSFTDVPGSSGFFRFIETLFHRGVTGGCGTGIYCPTSSTTREQMAVFVLLSKEGAGYAPPACVAPNLFADVPASSPYCRFIEELANRLVVTGCGPNLYCPTDPVTREQMAIFVLRTLDPTLNPPACTTPMFNDVPASSPFCRWIEELARRGVVTGCGGGAYCPTSPVTREQMGVFLSATFGLTLYGV